MQPRFTKQDSLRNWISNYSDHELSHTKDRCWGDCTRCKLHVTRRRVALRRRGGSGRRRLLLLGEAPGQFEDVLGIPFVGPAGRILTQIIKHVEYPFQYVITNVVCCRPQTVVWLDSRNEEEDINDYEEGTDYEIHDLNRDPEKSEMNACRPHIDEIFDEFNPDGIVYLGKIATNYSAPRIPTVEVKHPAYIARLEYKLLTVRKEARKISKFIEKLDAL